MVAQNLRLNQFIREGIVQKWGEVNDVSRQQQATLLMRLLLDGQSESLEIEKLLQASDKLERVLHRHTTSVNFQVQGFTMSDYNRYAGNVPHPEPFSYQIRELPLHRACRQGDSLETIRKLVEAFPESIQIPDSMSCLPLHCACGVYDGDQHNLEVVLYLMVRFPKALEITDRKGCLPLHHAVQSAAPLELVQALVKHFPDAVHVSRQRKQTECYCSFSSRKGHLPLDHANKRKDYKQVQEFLRRYTFPPFPELDMIFCKLRENPVSFMNCPDV